MNPIKPTIKTEIFPIILLIATIVSSFSFYSMFPESVPVHWNIQGEVDGYGSKFMAAFLLPAIIVLMYLMFMGIPFLDPKKDRYEQFKKAYHIFKTVLVSFMVVMYFLTSLNAVGYLIPIGTIIPIMVGALFIVLGNYFGKIKPNWFMGIRTPWTLSSEENWNKTHRFSAKVFILSGLLMMAMPWYPLEFKTIIFVVTIVMMVFGTTGYSLIIYLKNKNDNNKSGKPQDQEGDGSSQIK